MIVKLCTIEKGALKLVDNSYKEHFDVTCTDIWAICFRMMLNYDNRAICHQLLLSGETQYQSNLSSYLVSSWSKSLSISGGDSSCSSVLVRALGLIVKEEFKSVMLGGAWRCGELLVSSSTFAVIQRIRKSVPPQKHPHWKNTNTQLQYSLYCYSLDW